MMPVSSEVASAVARPRLLKINALLVLVSMIWGATFLITQKTIQLSGPFTYLGLCFAVAALTLACIFHKHLAHLTLVELKIGFISGLCMFAGYATQTLGLQYTTSSKAGFITGLYVPLVPLLALILLRQKPLLSAIVGIVLSVIGLGLISIDANFTLAIGPGEWLVLCCAFAFALQIIYIGRNVVHTDPINVTIIPLALTSVLSFAILPLVHEPLSVPPLIVWVAVLFMGIGDMAFTLFVMNWAQQYISGTRATLIYALESAWAGLFGVLAGQMLSVPAWIGCACIFLGMIAGNLRLPRKAQLVRSGDEPLR